MTENNVKVASAKSESELSLDIIRKAIKSAPALKLVEAENNTGFSYFMGKKRLCKLLKTKRGVTLEVNVKLTLKDIPGLETISAAVAHKKHLGTMKHLYRASDHKQVEVLIKDALKVFKSETEEVQKAETVEAPKTAQA